MNLAKLGIRRPITVLMVVLIVLIIGFIAFTGTPLDLLPDMELPILVVSTSYPGAGPEEVESMVTRPLEEALSTLDGLDSMSSVSRPDNSMVVLMFDWDTDMDFAALEAREIIDMVSGQLPDGTQDPTTMQVDPDMMPVMQVGISGDLTQEEITGLAEGRIQSELERVEGVATAGVEGGIEREIEVSIDPYKLSNRGISLEEVENTLVASNLDMSGGELTEGQRDYLINVRGEFEELQEIERLIVGQTSAGPVRIEDFAEVHDLREEKEPLARLDGEPTVSISIQQESGSNLVEVAEGARQQMDRLEEELPGNISFEIAMDQSEYIEDSIANVINMGVTGAIIAMVILWLFLGGIRPTIIIGAAIPLSVICAFILIYFQGYTLNMLTLGGLALGIGMMVDNAVVILENIFRMREGGMTPEDAAISGSGEVSGAITAATLTSVAVFFPIIFAEGMVDIVFSPLALTVAFALFSSLVVAIALIPVMTVKFLPADNKFIKNKSRIPQWVDNTLQSIIEWYEKVIGWSLGKRGMLVGLVLLLLVLSLALMTVVGTDFFPPTDEGEIIINVDYPAGTPLEELEREIGEMEKILGEIPEISTVFTSIGDDTGMEGMMMGDASATMSLRLVDESERELHTEEMVEVIREELPRLPGVELEVSAMDMAGGGMEEDPVNISVMGDDLEELERISEEIAREVEAVEGTREVATSFDQPRLQLDIDLDRDLAQSHGLTSHQVGSFLNTALSGSTATVFREEGEEYDVVLKMEHPEGWELSTVEDLLIPSPAGEPVPLEMLGEVEMSTAPREIEREDQNRSAHITAALVDRDLGSAMEEIQERIDEVEMPAGYYVDYGGEFEQMMDMFEDLFLVLVLAIILVYMVMAAQFESLMYPFIIMFTLPQTMIGVVLSLLITGRTMSVVAFIGVIMLAGIVVNNGIVMVDYINLLYRQKGYSRRLAIIEAGKRRLRPVLMTTLTTMMGMFPLALGIGEGAEMSAPMATVVIGGLAVSTLLTLIFVPVMYSLLDDLSQWLREKVLGSKEQPADPGISS